MSARNWTHAGVAYRMPDYRTAINLSKKAAAAPRGSTLEEQIDALPMWAEIINACIHDGNTAPPPTATAPTPDDLLLWLSGDLGWSLIEIITAGAACLTEINGRLYATMDGAIKHRDFSAPRTEAATSITS